MISPSAQEVRLSSIQECNPRVKLSVVEINEYMRIQCVFKVQNTVSFFTSCQALDEWMDTTLRSVI